jgi:hypothetical protein
MVILKMPIVTMGFIYHLIGESHENDGNPIHDGGKATPMWISCNMTILQ